MFLIDLRRVSISRRVAYDLKKPPQSAKYVPIGPPKIIPFGVNLISIVFFWFSVLSRPLTNQISPSTKQKKKASSILAIAPYPTHLVKDAALNEGAVATRSAFIVV
jgi:hypothetical protein